MKKNILEKSDGSIVHFRQKKCYCGHLKKDHYLSNAEISRGKVFCMKSGCTRWTRCDIKLSPSSINYGVLFQYITL